MLFSGNVSLTTIATKMRAKPPTRRSPISSPYSSTLNSTPNTLSRLRNSEACAGGTCARATFWMTRATQDAKTTR